MSTEYINCRQPTGIKFLLRGTNIPHDAHWTQDETQCGDMGLSTRDQLCNTAAPDVSTAGGKKRTQHCCRSDGMTVKSTVVRMCVWVAYRAVGACVVKGQQREDQTPTVVSLTLELSKSDE